LSDGVEVLVRGRAFFRNKSEVSEFRHGLKEKDKGDSSFTVILPAYRNSDAVKMAVTHLLEMGIPSKQILVVDDFSNDQYATATETSKLGIRVISINRNSKKVGAINLGLDAAKTDYVVMLDSDSFIVSSYPRLREAILEMQELGLDAMAGRVLPCGYSPTIESELFPLSEKRSRLLQLQWLEYDQAMRLGRGAMYSLKKKDSKFGIKYAEVSSVSGAFGIFRRTALIEALKRFEDKEESFLGEDIERTWKLLGNKGNIGYSDDVIILTSAPLGTVRHFKQRVIWAEGLFRCVFTDFGWSLIRRKLAGASYAISLVRDVLLQPLRILSIFFVFSNPVGFLSILLFYFILNIFVTKKASHDMHPSIKILLLLPFYRFYVSTIPATAGYLRAFLHLVNLYARPKRVLPPIGIANEWNGIG
jgi:cellulose synthase/poly-beta-1,6-N-acetylglucosamine synthase-like glycosyltransferase